LIVILMGVSGSGKSTVGRLLARELHAEFHDADDFHPLANIERMRAGLPLTNEHRRPWLEAIAAALASCDQRGVHAVFTCSALRRAHRDSLRAAAPVIFIHLTGPRELLAQRLASRAGHFFPPHLLDSQLDTLEAPGPDEAWAADIRTPPHELACQLASRLRAP
jgi:gluconokinase